MFKTELGNNAAVYTPENLADLAGALREAKTTGNQTDAELILIRIGKTTIDGMLLAEAEQSGEDGTNSDNDNIPYIAGGTKPFVFAAEGRYDFNTVGINNQVINSMKTSVYPNPANHLVFIDINLEQSDAIELKLYDISGKLLQSNPRKTINSVLQTISLDVSNLLNGVYFIRVLGNQDVLGIEKLIVKHLNIILISI
jgi:hypothetical protein